MIFNSLNAPIDAPPQSLKDSNASLKVKTTEKKELRYVP
jgi:hypothetical protein